MDYLKAFTVGGLICVLGQILIDKTKLTPARILVGFVCAGVVLGAFGVYEKLIDFANDYAKGIGFDRTYIPSEHMGLYEKYGYSYIKDIINYSGDTDHLYAKKLR